MWFCNNNKNEQMVMFEYTCCFYLLLTFMGHTKAFGTLKSQWYLFIGVTILLLDKLKYENNDRSVQLTTKESMRLFSLCSSSLSAA